MIARFFKRKSFISYILYGIIGVLALLVFIPGTRPYVAPYILKPTLFIHQPKVLSEKIPLYEEDFNWKLKSLNGETVKLSKFQGKVLVINFWATWCTPCIAEMPEFQNIYEQYGNEIEFLCIGSESVETLTNFVEKHNYTFPVYVAASNYPELFEIKAYPTTYIISKKNEVVVYKRGVAKWNSKRIRGVLDVLIKQ